jgi:hypothetical protein
MSETDLRLRPISLAAIALAAGLSAPTGPACAQDREPGRGAAQTQKINELLSKSWAENKTRPSARATDYEFLRRAYLDIIGRIATPAEVRQFELNHDRTRLIHRLLYDKVKIEGHEYDYPEEFARNWANIWTVWLMTRSANPVYREQIRGWLEDHFARNGSHKEMVEKLLTASGKTDENPAVNYILRHIGEVQRDGGGHDEGVFDAIPVTSRTTRLFLGLQTQCVQCHDHPFNQDWKQASFWGVNVFFKQVDREPRQLKMRNMNDAPPLTLKENPSANGEGTVSFEKRNGVVQLTTAVFLDGRKVDFEKDSRPRREVLADLIVTSPQFPKAYVNRIWGHLFGRGLNEHPAVDDFGEHNKVVQPELLDYLAAEFAAETPGFESGRSNAFDPKKLLYWICTSEAYSLSSVPNGTNDKPEADVWFSRMLLKAMTPEQLFESLTLATEGVVQKESREHTKRRDEWLKKLVVNFGDDEGNEITFNGTLLQALMLMNGKELTEAIKSKGTLQEAMKKGRSSPNRVIDELYLATLNRHPGGESARIGRYKSNDPNFYADLMWALLNSNEFILNH